MITESDETQLYIDPVGYALRCPCPSCGAAVGASCTMTDGTLRPDRPHSQRFRGVPS